MNHLTRLSFVGLMFVLVCFMSDVRAKPGDKKPGALPADLAKDLQSPVPGVGPTEEAAPLDPVIEAKIRKYLKQLEASELKQRDEAEQALILLGPKILPLLPNMASAGSQQAVQRIREKLELLASQTVSTSSKITLKGKKTLKELLAEFTRQTDNKFEQVERLPAPVLNASIEVNWQETPFWQALDEVMDAYKLTVYPFQQTAGLAIQPKPDLHLPRSDQAGYTGPIRIDVQRIALEREPGEATPPRMRIGLGVAWEPRIRPIAVEMPLAKVRAIDDQNKSWDSLRTEGLASSLLLSGGHGTELEVILQAPARSANTLSSLKGEVRMLLPGRVEQFTFENLKEISKPEQKLEQRIAQATLTIERIVKTNDLWEVQIKIGYDHAFEAFDSHLASWILKYQPQLIDAKGQAHEHAGYDTALRNDKEYGITFYYDLPDLTGAKWQYSCPVSLQRIQLDYEIKGIRLP